MAGRIRSGAMVLIAAGVLTGVAAAPAGAVDDAPPTGPPTATEVRAFLDERVPGILAEYEVPGAAVAVVTGAETLFEGGYGSADVAERTPVDPARTSFPTASVSKSFTAVAVLGLVDEGLIDPHADVNDYLPEDTRVPDAFDGAPVTMHHLLTHTAGFEEAVTGGAPPTPDQTLPLADYVRDHQPARIYPPGQFVAYSNYGTSMAGLIAQEVSGTPFEELTAERVFAPLGMADSAFAEPGDAAERFDTPSLYRSGQDTPVTEMPLNMSPAGAAYATASDVGRFMRFLLNDGELDGTRVLSAEGVEAVLARQAGTHPALTGSGYGTWEEYSGGPRVVGHSGDLDGVHTRYSLVPELDLGVYVAVNGDGNGTDPLNDARNRVVDEFLAEFAGTDPAFELAAGDGGDLERYAGTYVTTRVSRSDASALKVAMDQVQVSVTGDGTLRTANPLLGGADWTPEEPGVFRSESGERLAFLEEDGRVVGLGMDDTASQGYERVDWYAQPNTHLVLAGVALLVLLTVLAWPVTALVRRLRRRDAAPYRGTALAARSAAWAVLVGCAGFVVFLGFLLANSGLLTELLFTDSPLLTAPLAGTAVVAAGVVVAAVLSWRYRWWSLPGRLHYAGVALAAVVFLSVTFHYNLVWTPLG